MPRRRLAAVYLAERVVDEAADLSAELATDLLTLADMDTAVDPSIVDLTGDGLEARISERNAGRGRAGERDRVALGADDPLQDFARGAGGAGMGRWIGRKRRGDDQW